MIFVKGFEICQNRLKIDDVLGVWPLHGLCGLWGGIAAGIFGLEALGGLGGVTFQAQLVGSVLGAAYAFAGGFVVIRRRSHLGFGSRRRRSAAARTSRSTRSGPIRNPTSRLIGRAGQEPLPIY